MADGLMLEEESKKDKRTITALSVVTAILAFIFLLLIIGVIYFYSRLREPFQELITNGKPLPAPIARIIFKD